MPDFPQVERVLLTFFNAEDGLSEDVAIGLLQRAIASSANRNELEGELTEAFADRRVSWKKLLSNDACEVFDAASEEEALEYAYKILWTPIFGS